MAGAPPTDHRHLPDVHVHGDETLRTPLDALVIGGGQAGLAAGYHLRRAGLGFLILEAGAEPVGSWPAYYDSLTLFSPARYSALPGLPFPGDPDHCPTRDEAIAYLRAYARHFTLSIVPNTRVVRVARVDDLFHAIAADGRTFAACSLRAATGGFSTPYWPLLPGQGAYRGMVTDTHEYRRPEPFADKRVVVVGSGNSAVQVAAELATVAQVTLTSRAPLRFRRQRWLGRDFHFWLRVTGLDTAPFGPRLLGTGARSVLDDGQYRAAIEAGRPDHRPLFRTLVPDGVVWRDGTREHVEVLVLATGYRPSLDYLADLGALGPDRHPLQRAC